MHRLARVVAKNNHSVVLKLVQAEKCVACPVNCNKPLVDLFSLHQNLLTLSQNDSNYQLCGGDLFAKSELLDQLIQVKISNTDLMKSSVLLYFTPLVICLLFLSIGHVMGIYWQFPADLMALLGFAFGLLVVFLFSSFKKNLLPLKFRPKVTILSIGGT